MAGCRPECFDIDVIQVTSQMIHCKINLVGPCVEFFCSFVYKSTKVVQASWNRPVRGV